MASEGRGLENPILERKRLYQSQSLYHSSHLFQFEIRCNLVSGDKESERSLSLSMSDYKMTIFPSKRVNYGGTLAAARNFPLSIVKGLGLEQRDEDGRVITLEFDDMYLGNAYFPFAGDKLVKLDSKVNKSDNVLSFILSGINLTPV